MRAAVLDAPSQPYENLFTRPGLQADAIQSVSVWTPPSGFGSWNGNSNTFSQSGVVAASWAHSGKAYRITWATRSTATGDIGLSLGNSGQGIRTNRWAEIVGQRITAAFDLVTSADMTVGGVTVSNVQPGGLVLTPLASSGSVTMKAGVPSRIWATFLVPAGTTGIGSIRAILTNLPLTAGVYAEVSNAQVYLGNYDPARWLGDGSLPGWKWEGTAGQVESVGYPYSLESIAGAPLLTNSTPGSTTAVAAPALGALTGRTLYLVVDILATSSAWPEWAYLRGLAGVTAGQILLQAFSTAADLQARFDTNGGTSNIGAKVTGFRTIGRHIVVATANDGMTNGTCLADGSAPVSIVLTPGTGMANPTLRLNAATATDAPVFALAYGAEHNLEIRRRIMAWLARRYGAPIPAGY